VNRQPRTLLTLLLIAVIAGTAYFLWTDITGPPNPDGLSRRVEQKPQRGGRLTVTQRSEPRSFNRLVSGSSVTDVVSHLTQAKLVRINRATQQLEPWLAERFETAPGGTVFTLTLRDGLRWSDGTPFTTDDVLFTFRAAQDEKAGSVLASALAVNGQPIKVTAPDARTIRLEYPAPFGPGLRLLDNLPILPRHKLEPALGAGHFAQSWNAATPPGDMAGMGPFQLVRYEPGQRLVFARNPNFWRKADDGTALPYLDEVVMEIVPDQSAELLLLQGGEADMSQYALRPEDLTTLRPLVDQNRVSLIELGVTTDPDVFFLNLRDRFWAKDPRRAWITRREFRQAISHAIDREAFADAIYLGAGVPVWGPVTPGNKEWFSPNVPRYPYSVEQARAKLADIGLTNRDEDEWLEDEHGTEARFTLLTYRANQVMERESALLRDELRKIGVAVDVVPIETNALIDRMLRGDFESIFFNYAATDLDPAISRDFWLSSGAAHVWNMAQAVPATPWEQEIDALMAQQTATLDPEERRRLFAEVQRVFGEQVPALYLVAPRLYMAVSSRTLNLNPSVLRPQLLWSADTIAVTP
jgi:peptide/nickel transport system substrate-binding protein